MTPKNVVFREDWFSTPIFVSDHPTPEITNAKLIKDINKWYEKDPKGISRSNTLGWHSDVYMHDQSEYNHFTEWLLEKANEMMTAIGYHPNFEAFCNYMWANINKRYSYNKSHVHPGALWSGVYYIQIPKYSGIIRFTDPRGEAHVMQVHFDNNRKDREFSREAYYEPIEGRLLLFPGYLTHEVEPNLNEDFDEDDRRGWRYSLSFNLIQKERKL